MDCVAEQDDPALPPLLEPATAEEAPVEHLALHRPRDDRLCALVEARELLLELIDRRRDGPAFRFPLHPACDGYELQQLAAPDQIPVEVMPLPEGDGRFTETADVVVAADARTPAGVGKAATIRCLAITPCPLFCGPGSTFLRRLTFTPTTTVFSLPSIFSSMMNMWLTPPLANGSNLA